MTTLDLEAARELCAAATPGEWTVRTVQTQIGLCHKVGPFPSRGVHAETHACIYADNVCLGKEAGDAIATELRANAAFIAASRQLVPALLDALAQARTALAERDAALEGLRQYASDTLSGPAAGPEGIQWHRDGWREMLRRIRAASLASRAGDGEQAT